MLNSFLSLALDTFLIVLVIVLLTISSPSSASLTTTLCQALSSAPSASSSFSLSFGLPDLLGLSLEACEERFEGVVGSAIATLAVVEGLRGWGAVKVLQFYAALAQKENGGRHARRGSEEGARRARAREGEDGVYYDSPVELESGPALHRSPSGRKRRSESDASDRRRRERSSSGTSVGGGGHKRHEKETRIFLLPRPEERPGGRSARQDDAQGVPLLSLTTSSPIRSNFPLQTHGLSHVSSKSKRVLVYAPVRCLHLMPRGYIG